jgi:hypothetical protein
VLLDLLRICCFVSVLGLLHPLDEVLARQLPVGPYPSHEFLLLQKSCVARKRSYGVAENEHFGDCLHKQNS